MRIFKAGLVALSAAVLAGCAGGGGGGSGGGAGPTLPPPSNSSITNLVADQVFTGPAATTTNEFNLTTGITVSGSGAADTMSVSYNAAAKSYSVSVAGRSQTFSSTDTISSSNGETRFQKQGAAGLDRLTLVTTPYSGSKSNQYVGLGYWQRSNVVGGRQDDLFATFVYGLNTPAAAMPRTGRANFGIDVFGVSSVPGYQPSVLQGRGTFDVDFAAGAFSTQTYLRESPLLTGGTVSGGGIELIGSGLLSGSAPTFSGYVTAGSSNANLSGTLSGQFYGPGADELGASFSATNNAGASFTGSFTGQRADGPAVNLTLTNLVAAQNFYARGMILSVARLDGASGAEVRTGHHGGSVHDRLGGVITYGPGLSSMPRGDFTPASIVSSSNPNFTAYEATFDTSFGPRLVRMELFKVGSANTELALTYTTLGRWRSVERSGVWTTTEHQHFVYGLETPARLLAARTGTARYEGVAYGYGANSTSGLEYDVRGTSVFNIDFSSQTYSGDLALNGRNNSGTIDFGRYDFTGSLASYLKDSTTSLTQGGAWAGEITNRFYGPTGEEIGAEFEIFVPDSIQAGGTRIGGVTVARRK